MPDNQVVDFIRGRFDSLENQIGALRTSFENADARTNSRIDKLNSLALGGMGTALLALVGWVVSALNK
jgi:archaellum component FlaC